MTEAKVVDEVEAQSTAHIRQLQGEIEYIHVLVNELIIMNNLQRGGKLGMVPERMKSELAKSIIN